MTLPDTIARIEARGVELPTTKEWVDAADLMAVELIAALDEATAEVERLKRSCLHEWVSFRVPVTQVSEFYCARCDARKRGSVISYPQRGKT